MLNKRSIIGLAVGGVITAIGVYSLVTSLGLQEISVDDTYEIGGSTIYQFSAPAHSKQNLEINGTSFNVSLKSPVGGLQITEQDYKDDLSLEWVHLTDGESRLKIKNTGDSELHVTGTLHFTTEFIQITYHLMVIIAGLVIIGFSSAFSLRKPQGF